MNEESHDSEDEQEVHTEPIRSKRTRVKKSFGPEFLTYLLENELQNYEEAVNSLEGSLWKKAIKSEVDYILQNHIWELIDLPPGCKSLGSKWIFKRKMKTDGSIDNIRPDL